MPCTPIALLALVLVVVVPTLPLISGQQLPPFPIAPGVNLPAVSVGHADSTSAGTPCVHGRGPGCAEASQNMTLMWLRLGGRGVDTAYEYANQQQIGAAIKQAIAEGVIASRSSVFVTTKINPELDCTAAAALKAVQKDVDELGLPGGVDLALHHFPCMTDGGNKQVWQGLLQAKAQGLAKAVGVSHYSISNLKAIMGLTNSSSNSSSNSSNSSAGAAAMATTEAPSVNQCEMCVGDHDDETIAFCQQHGITYQAFGPLRSVDLGNQDLAAVATAHNVSTAAVALRWITQRGVPLAVSPGLNEAYAKEDMDLASFTLTEAEMSRVSGIN